MFDHFMIGPQGDCYEPDGYAVALSKTVVTLTVGCAAEYAARKINVIRGYLNFRSEPAEGPRRVLEEEDCEAGAERFTRFMRSRGYVVVPSAKANRREEREILVPEGKSTAYAQEIVGILRQFYQLAGSYNVGALGRANPIELPGWHLKDDDKRRASWSARYPSKAYGWLNAGLRFRVVNRRSYLPLIEDPTGCGEAMTKAVIAYGCPRTVIAICIVLQENGCRWREAAWLNALGWSILGFGATVFTTNKFDKSEHAKKVLLRPDVLSDTIRMFEARPHPTDPSKNLMDHLRELAAAGDHAALRRIPLFPNARGRRYAHRTFNGEWFRPAIEAWVNEDGSKGLLVFSDHGSRRPTPHWYRHAAITSVLEVETAGLDSLTAILEVCTAVCARFKLKTDQARRYAASLMDRLTEEAHQRDVLKRRAELAAQRATVDVVPALARQTISESEMLLLQMPARRMEAA